MLVLGLCKCPSCPMRTPGKSEPLRILTHVYNQEYRSSKQKVFRAYKNGLLKELWERAIACSMQLVKRLLYGIEREESIHYRPLKMVSKDGWKEEISWVLDGCFLPGPYPGKFNCCWVGHQSMGILSSCYAVVVNLKDKDSWKWKWELSGIPCTHAVASIWDQANNGIDTGIPESYCLPVHWLTTWKEMYKFKINPVNGPQGWKKSDVPTTIIPPKPHPQIGRPPKKRKKSAAELADEMMKSKKLTKTGKSVTCKSCKQVGHNSRGCKSKKGGGSQQAGVAGHGDAAHGSQQAGVHGSQTTQSTPQAS
ncbi:mutator type transposase [Tanacetum coccineum]